MVATGASYCGKAGQSIGEHDAPRSDISLHPCHNFLTRESRNGRQAHAQRAILLGQGNSGDKRHLVLGPPSDLAARALTTRVGIIHLNIAVKDSSAYVGNGSGHLFTRLRSGHSSFSQAERRLTARLLTDTDLPANGRIGRGLAGEQWCATAATLCNQPVSCWRVEGQQRVVCRPPALRAHDRFVVSCRSLGHAFGAIHQVEPESLITSD